MIDTVTSAMSNSIGLAISFLTAPLAIIVNVFAQIQSAVGSVNASLIALGSFVLILLTIRGKYLDNKKKVLEIKALMKDDNSKQN